MAQVRFKKMVLDLSGKPAPGYKSNRVDFDDFF